MQILVTFWSLQGNSAD